MKVCTECKVKKKFTEFSYISGLKKNGRFDDCKKCKNISFKLNILNIGGEKYWEKCLVEMLKSTLRSRTYSAFRNKGYKKNSKTQEMLGVDWEVCKAHIERQFTKGMNWDNRSEWHIDHIIPLASAKTEEELKKLCHYSNLQPLWELDNLSKSDKIMGQQNKLRI